MYRRHFLSLGAGAVGAGVAAGLRGSDLFLKEQFGAVPPAYSLIPVVGDGRWIWTEPPEETGYLEPRPYELKLGIQMRGRGSATRIRATTAAPVELPEQTIDDISYESEGCTAQLRQLTQEAGQLLLSAPSIARGQVLTATVTLRMTLRKYFAGYDREMFPAEQTFSRDFTRAYLVDSPGIQTGIAEVREVAEQITADIEHPWDKAHAIYEWVWESIRPQIGFYTSVVAAVRDRLGDCEERAAVFVAFCRIVGIPARLVWVPNHNWAEFCLKDKSGEPHWIPAHTSAYSWFGWTGAHELVLQKGDAIRVPESRRPQRLLADWMQYQGPEPEVIYGAQLRPLPPSPGEDAGPGARRKNEQGEWKVVGEHELDDYGRDGARAAGQSSP